MRVSSSIRALVTGGSRGIGRAIAKELAHRGCRIAIHYHSNKPAAEQTLTELHGEGHVALPADLSRPEAAAELWAAASKTLGGIDLLVNNAGIFELHPPLETPPNQWRTQWQVTLATNLIAPAELCHAAAQTMAQSGPRDGAFGRGRIVNISSRGAFRGEPHAPAYGASKAGLNALSQSLAKALAPSAIYVFCIAPGWVDTDMAAPHLKGPHADEVLAQHPLGRVATAEEIARTAAFCALDAPATMTGSIIDVNGASYLRT